MTDVSGFVVTLEEDLREDAAASTLEAIRHIKGVVNVIPIEADGPVRLAERNRASRKMWDAMVEAHYKAFK